MTTENHSTFRLLIATPQTDALEVILLMDAGPGTDSTIWDSITRELDVKSILTIKVSYPNQAESAEPDEVASAMIRTINQTHSACPSINQTVLVGSKSGCLALQIAMSMQISIATDLVLIDPDPLAPRHLADPYTAPDDIPEIIQIPTTTILPGASSTTTTSKLRLETQERDLSRFPNHRQIFAGRSGTCIVSERPDVVIDAIQRHLTIGRSSADSVDT